ncbi:MAG: radical SAM protein [Smithellaceae bacterium]|nr:radical SAM protein [Smithellaceae bacterium]
MIVRTETPDFAFWNTGTPTIANDLHIALLIRHNCPKTVTGVIGTHVSVLPEEALREPALDIVIRHEPERILLNVCRADERAWTEIKGISYRDGKRGTIVHNPDETLIAPEDILAPNWETLDISAYRLPLKGRRFLIVAPVRGCPYRCNFCTAPIYYGGRLRKRPVSHVIAEMEDNLIRFGIKDIFMWADTFTADRAYLREFCLALIDSGLPISWTCNSRVDTIDIESLRMMKEAGLWMISFGLESGNDEILRNSGKHISVDQSKEAVRMAQKTGLKVAGHFMFGLPGETMETMEQTLKFALFLPLDIAQFYAATPFPGTDLYELAKNNGWLQRRNGTSFSQSTAVMDLPGLPAWKVDHFRKKAYRAFYGRPSAILRLAAMVEPSVARNVFRLMKR